MLQVDSPVRQVLEDLWQFVRAGFHYHEPASLITPTELGPEHYYGPNSQETQRIRLLLSGYYTEASTKRPLQPSEYVVWRLRAEGRNVATEALAWLPGQWRSKLKGAPQTHIGILPKVTAVIEYFDADGIGRLGVVTAVTSEESLTIAGVGLERSGVLSTRTLTKSEWQAYGPVFISLPSTTTL